jgi:hypothetical protein
MGDIQILLPMLALLGWTLAVLLLIPLRRFKAGFAGKVSHEDFKNGESRRVPAEVSIPNRNFMNLLEVPVIFHFVCVLLFVTQTSTRTLVFCAWLYVVLRVVHSLIHLSYNNVRHRLLPFAASNVVMVYMWLALLLTLLRAQ